MQRLRFFWQDNLVPRVLVTLIQRQERTNKDLWDREIRLTCTVRPEVQESWRPLLKHGVEHMCSRTGSPRIRSWRIAFPQRSLLAAPPLDKGNDDSGSEIVFQRDDAHKILGLLVLLRMSGGTLYPRVPCCPFLPLDKGNEDSGNDISIYGDFTYCQR